MGFVVAYYRNLHQGAIRDHWSIHTPKPTTVPVLPPNISRVVVVVMVATVSRKPIPVTACTVTLGIGPGHGKGLGLGQVLSLGQGSASIASRVILGVGRGRRGWALDGNTVHTGVGRFHLPHGLVVHASVRVQAATVG